MHLKLVHFHSFINLLTLTISHNPVQMQLSSVFAPHIVNASTRAVRFRVRVSVRIRVRVRVRDGVRYRVRVMG